MPICPKNNQIVNERKTEFRNTHKNLNFNNSVEKRKLKKTFLILYSTQEGLYNGVSLNSLQ